MFEKITDIMLVGSIAIAAFCVGVYDTRTGLAIGVAACMLYWRYCWKNH